MAAISLRDVSSALELPHARLAGQVRAIRRAQLAGVAVVKTLLARACEWAECVGQSVVQLYVTASNERAIGYYQHEGFREMQVGCLRMIA
jgi:hypothetical protein